MPIQFKDDLEEDEILYYVGKKWVQLEAERRIGRSLSEDELETVADCIEWGLSTSIDVVFTAAIQEALDRSGAKDKWLPPYRN